MGLTCLNNIRDFQKTLLFILIFLCLSSIVAISAAYNEDKPAMEAVIGAAKPTPGNDYVVGSFNCRRCKVFIRADVGSVDVAPPPKNPSSGKKPKVGVIVGLTFAVVFVILAFVIWICWKRKSPKPPPVPPPPPPLPPLRQVVKSHSQQHLQPRPKPQPQPQPPPIPQPRPQPQPPPLPQPRPQPQPQPQPRPQPQPPPLLQPRPQPQPQPQPQQLPIDQEDDVRQQQRIWDEIKRQREEPKQLPQPQPPSQPPKPPPLPQPQPQPRPQQLPIDKEDYVRRQQQRIWDEIKRQQDEPKQLPQPQPQPRPRPRPRPPRRPRPRPRPQPQPQPEPQQSPTIDVRAHQKRIWDQIQQQRQQNNERGNEDDGRKIKEAKMRKQTHNIGQEQGNFLALLKNYDYKYLKSVTNGFTTTIGEGGFGKVCVGTLPDGTQIAIKRLKVQGDIDDFKNEIEALGRAKHFNLVKLLGYYDDGITKILVYEHMRNLSLEKWIFYTNPTQSLLTWSERKKIIIGIARGLVHLHDNCDKVILHRDLKPANVLLDDNKNAKLCDFGFAKLMDKDRSGTRTPWAGTPAYTAPEARLPGHKINDKIDVYSFGILVLEILFGKRNHDLVEPGQGKVVEVNQLPGLINRHLSEEMPKNAKDIHKIGRLAVWCIRKKPEERPSMCVVLASILDPDADFYGPEAREN